MKNLDIYLSLVLSLFFANIINSQEQSFDNKFIKENNIKTITVFEYDTFLKKGSAYTSFKIEYDKKGNMIKHTSFNNNDVFLMYTYTYDTADHLIEEKIFGSEGDCKEKKTYVFRNNMLNEETHFLKNKFTRNILYIYDDSNRLIKSIHLKQDSSKYILNYTYELNVSGKILKKFINGNLIKSLKYDTIGNTIEEIDYDKNKMISECEYQYYSNSKLMQLSEYNPSDKTINCMDYIYDAKWRLIKVKENQTIKEYIYNESGYLIEFIYYTNIDQISNGCIYKYEHYND